MNSETQITRPWRARSACAGHLPHHFRLGEANSDWGGAESIDSDVDMEMAEIPRAPSCSLEPTEFQVVPVAHEPPLPREKRSLPLIGKQRLRQHPLHQLSYLLSKLKDLFAPHEDEGFSLIGHLDLDMDLHLDEPACSCGHVQSQRPVSCRAPDATQGTRFFAPVFLSAEGPRAEGQFHADGRRGVDPCSLGGGAWQADAGLEASASGGSQESAE